MSPNYNPSESRFRAIFEQSPFSVQLLTPEGRTTHVNPAWKRLWGMSDEFIESYILKEYNMLEDQELVRRGLMDYIRRGFAGEATAIPEALYDPKANGMEGEARWISATIFPLKDENGAIREIVLIHTDSTVSHEAREKQARAAGVLKTLADTTAVLQSSVDPDRLVELFAQSILPGFCDACVVDLLEGNEIRRLASLHSLPEKQEAMLRLQEIYRPQLDSPQPGSTAIRTGQTQFHPKLDSAGVSKLAQNSEHARLAGQIGIQSVITVPLRIRGQVVGSINFVMTEGRLFDQQDVDLAEELARRASVAIDNARLYHDTRRSVLQRDEFISIASHELKTPLTTLKLHAQLAARQLSQDTSAGLSREYSISFVETVNRQINRLGRLIEDMLDISRISTGKLTLNPESVDLNRLVGEIARRFRVQLAAEGIDLRICAPEGPVPVRIDPVRIDQVLDNLLTNAIRYGNRQPIEVTLRSGEGKASVTVRDYGVGIARADQARIFERFERASSVSLGGLGLGLYISRDIARSHGGELWVESEPGQGAAFTLEIPSEHPKP